jgi:hypothetical protein
MAPHDNLHTKNQGQAPNHAHAAHGWQLGLRGCATTSRPAFASSACWRTQIGSRFFPLVQAATRSWNTPSPPRQLPLSPAQPANPFIASDFPITSPPSRAHRPCRLTAESTRVRSIRRLPFLGCSVPSLSTICAFPVVLLFCSVVCSADLCLCCMWYPQIYRIWVDGWWFGDPFGPWICVEFMGFVQAVVVLCFISV